MDWTRHRLGLGFENLSKLMAKLNTLNETMHKPFPTQIQFRAQAYGKAKLTPKPKPCPTKCKPVGLEQNKPTKNE